MEKKIKDYIVELDKDQKHYRELADFSKKNNEEMVAYWLGKAFVTDEAIERLKAIVGA